MEFLNRDYFFIKIDKVRSDNSIGGDRFHSNDIPSETTFTELLNSVVLFDDIDSSSSLIHQGLVKSSNQTQINNGSSTDDGGFPLMVNPSQLKSSIDNLINILNSPGPGGPIGEIGEDGDQGDQGPIGITQGIPGVLGPQGPQGVQGIVGPQGIVGQIGPQGPIGPSEDFTILTYSGPYGFSETVLDPVDDDFTVGDVEVELKINGLNRLEMLDNNTLYTIRVWISGVGDGDSVNGDYYSEMDYYVIQRDTDGEIDIKDSLVLYKSSSGGLLQDSVFKIVITPSNEIAFVLSRLSTSGEENINIKAKVQLTNVTI